MHRGGRGGRGKSNKHAALSEEMDDSSAVTTTSERDDYSKRPILAMFQSLAQELDAKHDRHERLVKMSRDITIESKRVIFLLHRAGSSPEHSVARVTSDARKRLRHLSQNIWFGVAKELRGQDLHQFLRAVSPGMQEYVEACSLLHYLCWEMSQGEGKIGGSSIPTLPELQDTLTFNKTGSTDEAVEEHSVEMPATEALLGLADISGELMRAGISALGAGQPDRCKTACTVLREIYKGFLSVNGMPGSPAELGRKTISVRQSLQKLETAWCAVKLRTMESTSLGQENKGFATLPILKLLPLPSVSKSIDEDEG